VERGGFVGIVRRKLIDDQDPAARPSHASKLADDAVRLRDVVERTVRTGEVEGAVRERQRRAVSLDELGVRQAALSGELEQLGYGVEPDDFPHERCESERECAGSSAHVERALVSAELDELTHLLPEPGGAGVLVCGDSLRGLREAVRHAVLSS
jgi:hypothetical protein